MRCARVDQRLRHLEIGGIEGLEQHEHAQPERGVDQHLEVAPGQHPDDGEHAAGAGRTAFEHLVPVDEEIR